MKQLIPVFLLLVLCWAVLWAQSAADSTALVRSKLDSLVAADKLTEASEVISAMPDSARTAYWNRMEEKALERVEMLYDSSEFDSIIMVLDSVLIVLKRHGRADSLPTARFWAWKAFTHKALEQFTDVLDAYNEAIQIYLTHKHNEPIVAYSYKNAAQAYIRRRDYREADRCLKMGMQSDSTNLYLLSIYGQLANNAYWKDSFDLALYYYDIGKNTPGDPDALASLRSAAATALIKKGRWQEAENLMRQALAFYKKEKYEGENRIRCYTYLAEIAWNNRQIRQAKNYYIQAEREGLDCFGKGKSRELAKLYCEWGDFLYREKRDAEAMQAYQKAIVQAYPTFHNLDPTSNPDPDEAPVEQWAITAPANKALLLLHNPVPENRRAAADCFDLAFAAAEQLRRTYGSDEAKVSLTQHNFDLRREAALNLWAMYRESGAPAHLERLFDLLENGRANTLRDALQQQRALALTGIPDSLLALEDNLRRDCAIAKTSLMEAETAGDSSKTVLRQKHLLLLERQYEKVVSGLRKNHARFREFSQAGQTANLTALRRALPDHAVLLTFFDASDRYLCLRLGQKGLSAHEISRDSVLDQALGRFQKLLADKNAQAADPAAFFADAYFLKQRLLPDAVLANAKALVVVPDGRLAYLPFEALLTAPHTGTYGKAPYLLRSHTVQYAWSAALLADSTAQQPPEKNLLHVAPFAAAARAGLATLPNSLNEKPENTGGDLLQGNQAQADTFLRSASAYDILHLSTHAHAGQQGQPGIEFYDRTVALPEIYAQRLNASLVALSACETNAGQFAEGEGVLSLARAFAYSGARSLVASYWSVNDRSTANLFTAFYRHLKKGMTKSAALRQAKLELLAEPGADARKMPYHWAAFTLSGADGQVALAGSGWLPWWAWALLGIGAGFGLIWYWRTNQRRQRV